MLKSDIRIIVQQSESATPAVAALSHSNKVETQDGKLLPLQLDNFKSLRLISLFCGAGGLDIGFKQAGFKTAIAFDHNPSAVASFNENHPGKVAQLVDIEKEGADGILALVRTRVPAGAHIGIIGGPPCQGFSLANSNSKADDPRNKLPRVYLEIVHALMTVYNVHFLLIENVSGIKAAKHSATLEGIVSGIESLGFVPRCELMNSVNYGVPQVRKRMILLGLRSGISQNFKFPKKKRKVVTVHDAIRGLPPPVFFDRSTPHQSVPFHPNHWTMKPKSDKFRSDYVAPPNARSFKRIEWKLPSKTIAFGNREILVHPSGIRRLSIYEAMLLQGFPSKFKLTGTLSSQVTQVSNAVPPPLAKSIALSLRAAITGL